MTKTWIAPRPFSLLLVLVALLLAFLSLAIGPANLPAAAIWDGLSGGDSTAAIIVRELRLPRALLGLATGFVLGLAGAALQGLLRNPLAEPGLLGISGTAAFCAVLVLYFGAGTHFTLATPAAGIAGALAAIGLLHLLAGRSASTATLVLAGVAMNSLAGAATALALNLAPSAFAAVEIAWWLLGSLTDRSFDHVLFALPFMVAGTVLMLAAGRGLDGLALGEDTAESLGVDLRRLRLLTIVGSGLAVGAAVAVCGAIGFVGLVVPHLLRPIFGSEPSRLMLPSGLGGAVLLVAADIGVRLVPTQVGEIKLGVITALVGAPFFFLLLWRLRRELP
jgi:iron complex transport system permease protein